MIPLCNKCTNAIMTEIMPGVSQLEGCVACNDIYTYEDAKRLCPVLKQIKENEK